METSAPRAQQLNILVVDDQPDQLLALEAALGTLGQNIVRAGSGTEALRHLLETDFAVILLDVQMPILDGFETATLIRHRERSRNTPIIFLTGVEHAEAQVFRGYAVGAVDYVLKPYAPAVLQAKVAVFLDLARKTRMLEEQAELLRHHHQELLELTVARTRLLADLRVATSLASSLDFDATLTSVTDLAVGHLADWCMIDVVDDSGDVCGGTASHKDGDQLERVRTLRANQSLGSKSSTLGARVLRSGTPEFASNGIAMALLAEHQTMDAVRAIGASTVLALPLAARGHAVGVLTLGWARRLKGSHENILALAQEFAERAALAIDNARLYRMAEDAVHARDDLLCIAAHELRGPLTPLLLQVAALQRAVAGTEQDAPEVAQRVSKMHRHCKRLQHLIGHLLDVSRIAVGHMRLEPEAMDFVGVLREAVERVREDANASVPEISLVSVPSVEGRWDPMRVEQIAANLISNAVKYGQGKPVEVKLEASAKVVRLAVHDDGIGIPAAQQERIFGRFQRATTMRRVSGLGLGLWIVDQIVRAHGGAVRVESAPTKGTTFIVELPRMMNGLAPSTLPPADPISAP